MCFNMSPQAKETKKSKHKQMGIHQTKNPLHSEGNYQQNERATY